MGTASHFVRRHPAVSLCAEVGHRSQRRTIDPDWYGVDSVLIDTDEYGLRMNVVGNDSL
jgi:hypothetical protein